MRLTIQTWRSFLPPLLLGGSLLLLYLDTLAPGLTWANQGVDGGDLITAAATGGIPHPTGYPLFLMLARLFQGLPVGSLAYRTNLMSAIFSVLAALVIYGTVMRALAPTRTIPAALAGLAAGYCFGLAPLVWSQAVVTEVYALQAFLVAWIVYLCSEPVPAAPLERKALDRRRGLALGLALGNQITTLFLVPAALLLGATRKVETGEYQSQSYWRHRFAEFRFDFRSLGRQLLWLAVGLSLYLILPLRALAHPPINWGNPVSPERLWWLVSAKLYQDPFLQLERPQLLYQLKTWADFTVVQFGFLTIIIALIGLIVFGKASRLWAITAMAAISALAFSAVYHPADGEVYLIPLLVSLSIWLGIGIASLAEGLAKRSRAAGIVVSLLLLGIILVRPVSYYRQVDASRDTRAESFGRQVLSSVPDNAILIARGDHAIFSLWYFLFALGQRPDLILIADELLQFDWYRESLRTVYPALELPEPYPWPQIIARANGQRPTCIVKYSDGEEIECMPALSMP